MWRNCVNARLLTSPCPRKLHPRTFEGGANTRFGNARELKVVHDIVRNRLEALNPNLRDLSVVEKLQIGQHLVHRTVALMLQQTFPLQEYDSSPDNLLFGQAEIVMCGSRYQLDLVEELAIASSTLPSASLLASLSFWIS